MELDKRIIEGKKPLDCFDIEIAKQFIGKKGLFGTHKSQFMNLDTCPKCVVDELNKIDNYDEYSFVTSGNHAYMYFLPEEWLKAPEKKYRPFTNEEFIELFDLGKFHSIRKIDELYDRLIITNIYHSKDNYLYISLTGDDNGYGLYWFFKKCEYFDGEWKPFGVIDE